jgi:heme oxygenase
VEAQARSGKLEWIGQDLASAGMARHEVDALPRAAFSPDLSRPASCFGLAYVIEGSQLGTKQLRQRLGPALDGWEPRWLEGYGARNGDLWRSFLLALGQHVRTPQEIDDACAAAVAGFDALACWFEHRRDARATLDLEC